MAVSKASARAITPAAKGAMAIGSGTNAASILTVGSDSQVLTADSTQTTGVKWATAAAPAFVGCRLRTTAAQTISNSTWTAVTFDAETLDTDGFHSTSSNTSRITIPSGKGGKYLFIGEVGWATSTSGYREMQIYKNGVAVANTANVTTPAGYLGQSTSLIIDLAVADYIELYVNQTTGGNTTTRDNDTFFNCVYLGA